MSIPSPVTGGNRLHDERANLSRVWWLFLIMGLLSIVVGFVALSSYFIATMATVLIFGILLLIAGVTEVIHAIMVRNWRGFALHLLSSAIYLLTCLFLLQDSVRAWVQLTSLLPPSCLAR